MENHAIVIGIDKYWTALSSLTGAVADAIAFGSWLVDAREVSPENLHFGVWPGAESPPVPPTLAGCPTFEPSLDGVNDLLIDYIANPRQNVGRLYFFFSGHGAASNNPIYVEEAMCLAGFSDQRYQRSLEVGSLRAALKGIPAEERFMFVDGCRDAVFQDDVRFGHLSRQPRPAPGVPRTYELRATALGRAAAEISGRGLFSRYLCDGLRGAGCAKRWDLAAGRGDGGYVVRWRALSSFVGGEVDSSAGAVQAGQLVSLGGDYPATADPQFAEFPAHHFEPAQVRIKLLKPAPAPAGTEVIARRNDSDDPDLRVPLAAGDTVTLTLPQSAWVLWAKATGYRSNPSKKPLLVYTDPLDDDIELLIVPVPPPPPPPQPRPDGSAGLESYAAPSVGDAALGTLDISVASRALAGIHPPLKISIASDSGQIVRSCVTASPVELPPGIYRIQIQAADGAAEEQLAVIDAQCTARLDLKLPGRPSPAVAAALLQSNKPAPVDGFVLPSESLGELAGASLATIAAIAVAQSAQGYAGELAALGLAANWSGKSTGLQVIIADERQTSAAEAAARTGSTRVHLWKMFVSSDGVHPLLEVPNPSIPLGTAAMREAPGGYWVELEDPDTGRRGGFKLGTLILPDHVTLVVRHQLASGRVDLMQFAIPKSNPPNGFASEAAIYAEALQRARLRGRSPLGDPVALMLIDGRWFEPFSAMLTACKLLDCEPEARPCLDRLMGILSEQSFVTVDMLVLRGVAADRAGDPATARECYGKALEMRQTPIVDKLLDYLLQGARAHNLSGPGEQWIAAKTQQAVGHPLWTFRREEDGSARKTS